MDQIYTADGKVFERKLSLFKYSGGKIQVCDLCFAKRIHFTEVRIVYTMGVKIGKADDRKQLGVFCAEFGNQTIGAASAWFKLVIVILDQGYNALPLRIGKLETAENTVGHIGANLGVTVEMTDAIFILCETLRFANVV